MADNETIADVLAAMRDEGRTGESSCLEWVGAKMRHYADSIEAAHKREVREAREAVDYLCERMADLDATFDPSEVECLRAALATMRKESTND